MTRWLRLIGAAALGLGLALPGAALADGGGDDDDWRNSKLKPVQDVIALGDYDTAIQKLDALLADDPENPDVLNLLGFSHRQKGDYDVALDYYTAALDIKPKHLGANEYLGELYLQTGQLAKAEERLKVLDRACFFGCKEYDKLEEAIALYKKKNGLASQ